jgi:hypothetical protein
MPQTQVSGAGFQSWTPEEYQYRAFFSGEYRWPLNVDKHGYPVPTSAVRQLNYSGSGTWNRSGYDYSDYANVVRREPLEHQEQSVIINYMKRNPANPYQATPIAIANYAVSTGMIYVGNNAGNWGGIQVGQISPGGYNGY